ncbi:ATP-grasp domain-containing protein [Mucilaginibacter ginkgonis]|uniref:PylC N-terminal domain-containing protein n=1 Tax=Mucilaginibacter ginkgonis TaxID=2682091 RepID=A0A6I4I0G3_9SPHI|nr:hypothetical protein [Mucilaginibacter ginkgonis]QQL50968.1 hypothetical protein GO620_005820 [Mucilaginibacter ginkgonis]
MTVLITCALGAQAHQLKKTMPIDTEIILGDYADVPEVMIKSKQIIQLPSPAGPSYQHQMLALCLDNRVDAVYPLDAKEFNALAESEQLFAEYGISINRTV